MGLVLGYDSSEAFDLIGAGIPPEATFVAQVRPARRSPVVPVTLSPASGTIQRISSSALRLRFSGALTADWRLPPRKTELVVFTDIVRTDLTVPQHFGWIAELGFAAPVTVIA